ncbi:MAG TPA: hypothetical protein VM802_23640 [Chitinophaga sp.]|uniref:hypothetical protein n=1 Tax=Chitinophaga sp. TaxID=1869181 RepID=UPI002B8A8C15|nr:hypothetical protein [Chitinophaga sp.]HVI47882.1 hypothetical protein [Chitinophaga sp.]
MDSKTIVLERIRKKLSGTKMTNRYYVPGMFLLGVLVGGGCYLRYTQTGIQPPGWAVAISFALVLIAITLLATSFKTRNDSRLLELVETPSNVVWIYQHILRMNGVPQESMMVGDNTGKIYQLPVKRKNGEDPLMDALVEVFPGAVLGFSYELKKLYNRNPGQFREAVKQIK